MTSAHKWNDVRIFIKECSALAAYGFDVSIVATDCPDQIVNEVRIVGVNSVPGGRFTRMRKTSSKVVQKAIELNADIYHFHDPELLQFAKKLKALGKKVIYDSHEDVPRQILGKYWINKYLRKIISKIFERYENKVVRSIDSVVAATPHIRERFAKINPNCVDVCNYPILEENYYATEWKNKTNAVCYIGGVTKIRGALQIVEAIEQCNAQLIIAGEITPKELEEQLKALKGWSNVDYLGFVDRKKVYEVMDMSIAGLVTLHPTINYLDSLPIKMFEYMSAGIPVIASNFPLWKEIIEGSNSGICVDPMDSNSIANAINLLLNDRQLAERMGSNGRKIVTEKYNWRHEASKLIALYKSLI